MIKIVVLVLLFVSVAFSETYLIWQDAIKKGYALSDSPGPNLNIPQDKTYEGVVRSEYYDIILDGRNTGFYLWYSYNYRIKRDIIASFDLNRLRGTIVSAKIRAEFFDYMSELDNQSTNLAGNIDVQIAIGDAFLVNHYTDNDYTYCSDDALIFSSAIGLWWMTNIDTITIQSLQGQSDSSSPSPLWRQFVEIDVTPQVQWILNNNDSAQNHLYTIIMTAIGGTGRLFVFGKNGCDSSYHALALPGDKWTNDCNTLHFLIEGSLTPEPPALAERGTPNRIESLTLASYPNPFNPTTTISYVIPGNNTGMLSIYSIDGKRIIQKSIMGQGEYLWNARGMVSGIYLCRLGCDGKVLTKKVLLAK
ncbi:MAG: hypothetical protein A2268_02290 [Candidatus Raymondbacteria bacterium RifOxyA12_full_50_37]|uniref:Secretion system C-terminal sorting domain-containing protein n=1 Tax=Candidatus Raymondbacteria bacterium RIFOXYD12_FULL_49_13 TaxID=1817890 RepID=A0A1F7F5G5_UNCRA|nr:MAG: hypothetical protein A2350_07815 [Candidatus Raymondbacteria bacterium RifOxyB12_full_50_8]OGJ91284.1 MAG: hypothetical protein A2268_02290 [Candidatus Raymondbacteria bacterium RifOxyA12_full_50_37]OGJ92254.1 MAG: hypothetical protein A2248_11120 [Candidatus Raymondbacteria bacterium RIFOXYA2_FULL_49_16]OGJ98580.1 MAG: hypothetical protein A2453_06920 [Candidatus Raymondbacteria bacterium RIFOXYC2_FULL_50_21]OGK01881.1 MAG: hypothetical protein A2519_04815 [Candidatus Raymondbacteria b